MDIWKSIRNQFRELADITAYIDMDDAGARIRNNIWFRGPNVWILAFSIIVASVGLNINSTAVIIGAMLISPLMGPIVGMGLSLGINDLDLLKSSAKNFAVATAVSVLTATVYFLLPPYRKYKVSCWPARRRRSTT